MGYTYVCSDVHGDDRYFDALALLGKEDKLYIIGDVLDRGPCSIEIIQDIMKRDNVILIKGNHEQMQVGMLERLHDATSEYEANAILEEEMVIAPIGQRETLEAFIKLNSSEQMEIIYFLKNLPFYEELTVNNKNYILVHAGLPDFSYMPIEYYSEDELVWGPHNYEEDHYENTTVIIGHTPTRNLQLYDAEPDKIFRINDTINVDCGLGFGGRLGILCLDTNEEIYY